jgi:hypothetical protein
MSSQILPDFPAAICLVGLAAGDWQINTAFVGRRNLDLRQHASTVGRRVNTLCKHESGLRQQLTVYRGYHNFCLSRVSVRQPLPQPVLLVGQAAAGAGQGRSITLRPGRHMSGCWGVDDPQADGFGYRINKGHGDQDQQDNTARFIPVIDAYPVRQLQTNPPGPHHTQDRCRPRIRLEVIEDMAE